MRKRPASRNRLCHLARYGDIAASLRGEEDGYDLRAAISSESRGPTANGTAHLIHRAFVRRQALPLGHGPSSGGLPQREWTLGQPVGSLVLSKIEVSATVSFSAAEMVFSCSLSSVARMTRGQPHCSECVVPELQVAFVCRRGREVASLRDNSIILGLLRN